MEGSAFFIFFRSTFPSSLSKIFKTKMKVAIDISPLTSGHQSRGVGYYLKGLLPELKKIKNLEIIEWDGGKNLPKVDLIHIPFFDLFYPTLPIKKLAPTVVTIHDVTPLKFPGQYPPGIRGKLVFLRQKIALRRGKKKNTYFYISKKKKKNKKKKKKTKKKKVWGFFLIFFVFFLFFFLVDFKKLFIFFPPRRAIF